MRVNLPASSKGAAVRAPLIGRDNELSELKKLASEARGGQARTVIVLGPTGIGKTRLLAELAPWLTTPSGGFGRVYRAPPRSAQGGHGALTRLLAGRFGISESMSPEQRSSKVESEVAAVLGDRNVGDICYFLGPLMDIRFPPTSFTLAVADEPNESRALRHAVLRRFLEADAARAPICMVVEDLHQFDADALELFKYLMRNLRGPILLLCTARQELLGGSASDWEGDATRQRSLGLERLSDEQSVKLMETLLEPCLGGPPEPLVEAAVAASAGNPGLMEQMVRIFIDTEVLQDATPAPGRGPSWKVNIERLASARIPMTAEDAAAMRITSLSSADRRVLEYAAAMGSVFWLRGLLTLSRLDQASPDPWIPSELRDLTDLESLLVDLERRDYILALPGSTFSDDREYVFQHNLEREKLSALTSGVVLLRYHQAIADWMSLDAAADTQHDVCAMLGQHLERAGSRTRAGLTYLRAADLARSSYSARTACDLYDKGLLLIGETNVPRRIDALHNYGDVLLVLGRTDDALAAFREMLRLAFRLDTMGKGGAAHNRIGRLYRDSGSLDEALQHLEAGLSLFAAVGDVRGVAASHDDIGKLLWIKGEYQRALQELRTALDMRRPIGDRRSIALSLNNMGLVWMDHGSAGKAREAFESALGIRREIGDAIGTAESLANLGILAADRDDWERALALFEEAFQVSKGIGERNRVAAILTHVGTAQYHLGRPEAAIEVLERAEDMCDEVGDKLHLARVLRALAKAYLLQGRLRRARDCIKRAVDLFGQVRSKPELAIALRTLAEVTAAGAWGEGHEERVVDYFMRSIVIMKEIDNQLEVARSYRAFSAYVLGSGRYESNSEILRQAQTLGAMADDIFARHSEALESSIDHAPVGSP